MVLTQMQLYYPEGFTAANTLGPLGQKGIVAAGGLHKEIKGGYTLPQASCEVVLTVAQTSTSASATWASPPSSRRAATSTRLSTA